MKEVFESTPNPEFPNSETSSLDIRMRVPENITVSEANEIYKNICDEKFDEADSSIEKTGRESEENHIMNDPEGMTLENANQIFDKLFDSPEYDDGTRELSSDEKQHLKDALGWSDDRLKKCTVDGSGVIHYKTDRCDLEGKTSENGIPYVRRQIEINGVKIEGVFPVFSSVFDTELNPNNLKTKAYARECNAKLKKEIENNPDLAKAFNEEQLSDIEAGRTPTGYVWHHHEIPGKMQLVKREDHDRVIGGAAHTGGNSLWGADSVDNSKKGESF